MVFNSLGADRQTDTHAHAHTHTHTHTRIPTLRMKTISRNQAYTWLNKTTKCSDNFISISSVLIYSSNLKTKIFAYSSIAPALLINYCTVTRKNTNSTYYFLTTYLGRLPRSHNKRTPYRPHDAELPPALPYKIKMIDGEGYFFLADSYTCKPDTSLLTPPQFTKKDFLHDLYKLIAMGASGPV